MAGRLCFCLALLPVVLCAAAMTYPMDKEVPGIGRVLVLAKFEFGLPAEGAAGLVLGCVLQVPTTTTPLPTSAEYQAFEQVRGLKVILPVGGWPAQTEGMTPAVLVADPASADAGQPLGIDPKIFSLSSALMILVPTHVRLAQSAQISLPVDRKFSRDPQNGELLRPSSSLAAHQHLQGKWQYVGGKLSKGINFLAQPVSTTVSSNTDPLPPLQQYDWLTVESSSFGAIAVMQMLVEPIVADEQQGSSNSGLGTQWIWIIIILVFGSIVFIAVCYRMCSWYNISEWRSKWRQHASRAIRISSPLDDAKDLENGQVRHKSSAPELRAHSVYAEEEDAEEKGNASSDSGKAEGGRRGRQKGGQRNTLLPNPTKTLRPKSILADTHTSPNSKAKHAGKLISAETRRNSGKFRASACAEEGRVGESKRESEKVEEEEEEDAVDIWERVGRRSSVERAFAAQDSQTHTHTHTHAHTLAAHGGSMAAVSEQKPLQKNPRRDSQKSAQFSIYCYTTTI